MPRHKMRHCYSINFLSKWAKPDPLKPFPYSLRTVLITQLEAGPVLSAAAFWARERSITQKRPHCLRLPHRRVPGLPPKSQEDLQIQTVTPSAAFPPWSPCGREGTAPASVALTGDFWQPTPAGFPTLPACRGEGVLESWISSWLCYWQPASLWGCTASLGRGAIMGEALVAGESGNFFNWSHY